MPIVDPGRRPRVSVVCSAYDSHDTIEESLRAIEGQTFRDFEIIVVNSSPETRTGELVTRLFPSVLFIQSPVRLYPQAARNRGIGEASGELLVFTDPDCVAAADWLEKLVAAMDRGYGIAVGGMGIIAPTWRETGIHLQKFYWCLAGAAAGELNDMATANVCISPEVWRQAGPFRSDIFCGDTLFAWRARRSGFRIAFAPQAVVRHHHGMAVGRFIHERATRGREFARVRSEWQRWSKTRSLLYLLATPLLLVVVSARGVVYGMAAGYGWRSFTTAPLQLLGHTAWLVGEARAHLAHVLATRSTQAGGDG
jgi:GT2 family glycosyltransferase